MSKKIILSVEQKRGFNKFYCETSVKHIWYDYVSKEMECPFCNDSPDLRLYAIRCHSLIEAVELDPRIQFIVDWWDYPNNILKPENVSAGAGERIVLKCNNGHYRKNKLSSIVRRITKTPCYKCSLNYPPDQVFEDKNSLRHPIYDFLREDFNRASNKEKIERYVNTSTRYANWKCIEGHTWRARICDRVFFHNETRIEKIPLQDYLHSGAFGYFDYYGFWYKVDLRFKVRPPLEPFKKLLVDIDKSDYPVYKREHSYFMGLEAYIRSECIECLYAKYTPILQEKIEISIDPSTLSALSAFWDVEKNKRELVDVDANDTSYSFWRCDLDHLNLLNTYEVLNYGNITCTKCDEPASRIEIMFREEFSKYLDENTINSSSNNMVYLKMLGKARQIDITGKFLGKKVAVLYDGAYWHKDLSKTDSKVSKALILEGYIVIRIRENTLRLLPKQDNLLQYVYKYSLVKNDVSKLVKAIINDLGKHS